MKKIYKLIFVFIICRMDLMAQNYTVGVPVDDTLTIAPMTSGNCYPNPDVGISFPPSTVTGIDHILILNVPFGDTVYAVPFGMLNPGIDTLYFTTTQSSYSFYFKNSNGFLGIFKAIGIPQIANETYDCGPSTWIFDLWYCPASYSFMYASQCTVAAATAIKDIISFKSDFILSPNPFHTTATLTTNFQFPFSNYQLKIFDVMGRMVKEQIVNQQSEIINREGLSDGLYFYELRTKNYELMGSGKFIIE